MVLQALASAERHPSLYGVVRLKLALAPRAAWYGERNAVLSQLGSS
jgi:hypothetical protein